MRLPNKTILIIAVVFALLGIGLFFLLKEMTLKEEKVEEKEFSILDESVNATYLVKSFSLGGPCRLWTKNSKKTVGYDVLQSVALCPRYANILGYGSGVGELSPESEDTRDNKLIFVLSKFKDIPSKYFSNSQFTFKIEVHTQKKKMIYDLHLPESAAREFQFNKGLNPGLISDILYKLYLSNDGVGYNLYNKTLTEIENNLGISYEKLLQDYQAVFEEEKFYTGPVFEDPKKAKNFDSFSVDMIASVSPSGKPTVARYINNIFVIEPPGVVAINNKSEIVSVIDKDKLNCNKRIASINVIGDDLFLGCNDVGLYQINIPTNKVTHLFDWNDGLSNLWTLQQIYHNGFLWVATNNGIGKIDINKKTVSFYAEGKLHKEDKEHEQFNSVILVNDENELEARTWGTYQVYDYETDSWKINTSPNWPQSWTGRENKDDISLEFNDLEKQWEITFTTEDVPNADVIKINGKKYYTVSKAGSGFILLSEAGIEIFNGDDTVPRLVTPFSIEDYEHVYRGAIKPILLNSDDGLLSIFLLNTSPDESKTILETTVMVYNHFNGNFFVKSFESNGVSTPSWVGKISKDKYIIPFLLYPECYACGEDSVKYKSIVIDAAKNTIELSDISVTASKMN